jgi:hypothetical protein
MNPTMVLLPLLPHEGSSPASMLGGEDTQKSKTVNKKCVLELPYFLDCPPLVI